ncbi:MAG: DUF5615 family PIN-like protein [Acidobacteria bacterium]|nr:DUF5615 family PIN-like protein [Acidobacteriota bacterium]
MAGKHPRPRLYLDEDVHKRLAKALRLRGFEARSAHEIGQLGLSDQEQLDYAAASGLTLFTFHTADYVRLHVEWLKVNREHSGIIVSDQLSLGEVVRRLLHLLNRMSSEKMANQLYWLQMFK